VGPVDVGSGPLAEIAQTPAPPPTAATRRSTATATQSPVCRFGGSEGLILRPSPVNGSDGGGSDVAPTAVGGIWPVPSGAGQAAGEAGAADTGAPQEGAPDTGPPETECGDGEIGCGGTDTGWGGPDTGCGGPETGWGGPDTGCGGPET
ncbi:hypothetical protein C1I95_34480, partial [Micromonospora craterilacus]